MRCPIRFNLFVSAPVVVPVENEVNNGVNGVNGTADEQTHENGDASTDHGEQEKPVHPEKVLKKIRVTYEEYRTIANLLILHMRQLEEASGEGMTSHDILTDIT